VPDPCQEPTHGVFTPSADRVAGTETLRSCPKTASTELASLSRRKTRLTQRLTRSARIKDGILRGGGPTWPRNRLRRACPRTRAAGRTLHPAHPKVNRREARNQHDPTSLPCLVYFTPATLTSLRLQGVDPSEDQASLSALLPPVPFVPASGRGSELRRVDPSGSRSLTPKRCAPSPLDVFPLRFSLSPRWGTASRPLLSRAFRLPGSGLPCGNPSYALDRGTSESSPTVSSVCFSCPPESEPSKPPTPLGFATSSFPGPS
jgi:hypothetical protein